MASNSVSVNVKLPDGQKTCYDFLPQTNLSEVCKTISKDLSVIPQCIQLKYDGKILRKQHSLCYLGIYPETVLKVLVVPREAIQLQVKLESGAVELLKCQNVTTILELKQQLTKNFFVNSKAFLQHYGTDLTFPDQTLRDYDIRDNDVIDVLALDKPNVNQPQVHEIEMNESEQQQVLESFAPGLTSDTAVEVVFSFDTTGSMSVILDQVRDNLRETITRLLRDIPNIRIGIMAHGDYCDEHIYVLKTKDLTSDMDSLIYMVDGTPGSGGNFACYEWVLKNANELSWSPDSAKALVIIGDVVPHSVSYTSEGISWRDELNSLCEKGVKVYGVQAKNFRPATSFYKELARKSGGAYISFQHFHLITDMFLAVCYKESGAEQLEAFQKEAENEGRLTEELSEMFTQLKEPSPDTKSLDEDDVKEETRPQDTEDSLYVRASWWDVSLDMGMEPKFIYDHEKAKWQRQSIRHVFTTGANTSTPLQRSENRGTLKKLKKRIRSIIPFL